MWNSKMNAIAASRHEEFAGRLQSTGNKAELYVSPMDTGSNSRYRKQTLVAPREFLSRKLREVVKTTILEQDQPNHKIVGGVCLHPLA